MQACRLFPGRFRSTAFTGVGGLYAARRWNHLGAAMVYTSTSLALAALEFFVDLEPNDAPNDLLMGEAVIPESLEKQLNLDLLPSDWRKLENQSCRDLGSGWAESGRSVALKVPSAVVEGDSNILLNPAHPDFGAVALAKPVPFHFDPRMFR